MFFSEKCDFSKMLYPFSVELSKYFSYVFPFIRWFKSKNCSGLFIKIILSHGKVERSERLMQHRLPSVSGANEEHATGFRRIPLLSWWPHGSSTFINSVIIQCPRSSFSTIKSSSRHQPPPNTNTAASLPKHQSCQQQHSPTQSFDDGSHFPPSTSSTEVSTTTTILVEASNSYRERSTEIRRITPNRLIVYWIFYN